MTVMFGMQWYRIFSMWLCRKLFSLVPIGISANCDEPNCALITNGIMCGILCITYVHMYLFYAIFYHSFGDRGLSLSKRECLEAFVHTRLLCQCQ